MAVKRPTCKEKVETVCRRFMQSVKNQVNHAIGTALVTPIKKLLNLYSFQDEKQHRCNKNYICIADVLYADIRGRHGLFSIARRAYFFAENIAWRRASAIAQRCGTNLANSGGDDHSNPRAVYSDNGYLLHANYSRVSFLKASSRHSNATSVSTAYRISSVSYVLRDATLVESSKFNRTATLFAR